LIIAPFSSILNRIFMDLSQETKTIIARINEMSGNTLQRSMDLARLIDLSRRFNRGHVLDDLAFLAKFLSKSFEIMKRIGKEGEGYDKLFSEFSVNVTKSQYLIASLIEGSSDDVAAYFTATYCSVGEKTMNNLMQLIHDLGWYKNYRIDTKHTA